MTRPARCKWRLIIMALGAAWPLCLCMQSSVTGLPGHGRAGSMDMGDRSREAVLSPLQEYLH
mgnify:CR=1 FL=1